MTGGDFWRNLLPALRDELPASLSHSVRLEVEVDGAASSTYAQVVGDPTVSLRAEIITLVEERKYELSAESRSILRVTIRIARKGPEMLVAVTADPLLLRGSYRKFRRDVSQTKWLISDADGAEDRVTTSVEELIGNALLKCYEASGYSLHGAGREDVDVLMLGDGRPFVMSLKNCHHTVPRNKDNFSMTAKDVENLINAETIPAGVEVLNLEFCDDVDAVKSVGLLGEEKRKQYALIAFSSFRDYSEDDLKRVRETFGGEGVTVNQKTPIRVLHRRTLSVRPRNFTVSAVSLVSPREMAVSLITDAGAYVKEFVSGDFRRTCPSLASVLNTPLDLVCLDVTFLFLEPQGGEKSSVPCAKRAKLEQSQGRTAESEEGEKPEFCSKSKNNTLAVSNNPMLLL